MRQGRLVVELNNRVRDNLGFYDPVTCTQLHIQKPKSGDLNRELFDRNTGARVQMDLTGRIEQGIRSGVLRVTEGKYTDRTGKVWEATACAPIEQQMSNPAYERKWQETIMSAKIAMATKNNANSNANNVNTKAVI